MSDAKLVARDIREHLVGGQAVEDLIYHQGPNCASA